MISYDIELDTDLPPAMAGAVKVCLDQVPVVHEANVRMHGPRRAESSGRPEARELEEWMSAFRNAGSRLLLQPVEK